MLLLSLIAIVPSVLAFSVIPGLTASDLPQCTYLTVYYTDLAELAIATDSIKATSAFCSTTATSTSAAPASTTSTRPHGVNILQNPDFEIGNGHATGWTASYNSAGPVTISSTSAEMAQNGTKMVVLNPTSSSARYLVDQTVSASLSIVYLYQIYFRTDSTSDVSGCVFTIGRAAGNVVLATYSASQITPTWTLATAQFAPASTNAVPYFAVQGCVHSPNIYVDNAYFGLNVGP